MENASIIRFQEYTLFKQLELNGRILDVGGSKKSGYHEIVGGEHSFFVINIDESCGPELLADIEQPFALQDGEFDHAVCLNVLEHIFEFEHVFKETLRCVKEGGNFVIATPMLFHIHGSPDDYLRYTESSYRRLAKKHNCEVVQITPLGTGLLSFIFQTLEGAFPHGAVKRFVKKLVIKTDTFLNRVSKKYHVLTTRIPLGYFVVLKKRGNY